MTRTLSILTLAFALTIAGPVAAQPSAESKAAAEALFDEGKKLMDAGDYANACPKFEQSDALDPALGTELNLGACYEKVGRTASAWATFRRAAAVAKAKKQPDREKLARSRADALEATLSRLTVVVPEASRVSGLVVSRNGVTIGPELFGQAVPVDPGTLSIEASAPGKVTFVTQVALAAKANQALTIPVLENDAGGATTEPTPAAVAPIETVPPVEPSPTELDEPPPDSSAGSSQRTLGLVVGAAGIVGVAVAGVFVLKAKSKYDDSKAECLPDDANRCTPRGVELRDEARSAGNVATIAGGLGLAALIGGSILYFTAPTAPKGALATRPRVGLGFTPAGPSFAFRGAW